MQAGGESTLAHRPISIVLLSLLFLATFSAHIIKAETITVRADLWMPFNGQPEAANPGYVVELVQSIFNKLGHQLDYRVVPWQQAIDAARSGRIDAVIGAERRDAPDFIFPAEPIGMDSTHFFVKKSSRWHYAGIESLAHLQLGVVEAYNYDAVLEDYIKKNRNSPRVQVVFGDAPLDANLKKLLEGKIDALLENPVVFYSKIHETGLKASDYQDAGLVGKVNPLYVAFSPARATSAEYARLLSQGIRAYRANGELGKLLDRYRMHDWQ